MKKILFSLAIASCIFYTGCLSTVRFCGMPNGPTKTCKYDHKTKTQNCHTNTWCCYPTVWMRYEVTRSQFDPTNEKYHWYNWIPITIVWLTTPLDGIVDTVLIPWDISAYNERMKRETTNDCCN